MANDFDVILNLILKEVGEGGEKTISKLEEIEQKAFKAQLALGIIGDAAKDMEKRLTSVFTKTTVGLGLLVAEANRYAKNVKIATEETAAWEKQTARLAKSRERVDAVLLRELLPLLQKAAELSEKAAGIIERHPEIVSAALKAGVVVAGLSAVGIAVTKGIRLVADIGYITASANQLIAARLQDAAANKQIIAAGASSKVGGAKGLAGISGGGGALAAAGTVASVVAAVTAGGVIGVIVNDILAKSGAKGFIQSNTFATGGAFSLGQTFGNITGKSDEEIERKATVFAAVIGRLTGAIDENSPLWLRAVDAAEKTTDGLKDVVNSLEGSANESEIVEAFADMQDKLLDEERDFERARVDIVNDATDSILDATQKVNDAISAINSRAASQRSDIVSDYVRDSQKAQQAYELERARIVRDGGREIVRLEERRHEQLRKLENEHNQRVLELTDQRDALGVFREQNNFLNSKEEIDRSTNQEIQQRRQDIAQRLKDLADGYAQERAQRAQEYQQKLQENEERRAAEVKQKQEELAEEIKRIREDGDQRLKALDEQHNLERQKIRDAFINRIRDLDASLLGEANRKRQYYALMLADAERFLSNYRQTLAAGLSGGAGAPIHDYTGYAYTGMYKMANDGQRQFVMSGNMTRFAERLLGGQLNQQMVLNAMAGGTRSSGVNYVDNSRYAAGITARDRKTIRQDIRNELREILK